MADIIVDGQTRVSYVPTISNIAAPTTAELNAGTALESAITPTGLNGWDNTTAEVDNTALNSTFDTKLPGRTSWSGTSITFKKATGTDTIWNLMTVPGTNGYIVFRDGVTSTTAWATSDKVEVYPIRTAAHNTNNRGTANSLLTYTVPTPITSLPNLKAVVA